MWIKKIKRSEYNEIHPDFKWKWEDWIYRVMKLEDWVTKSVPVEIID